MPNIQSARKRLKQSIAARERNRSTKSSIRTECKKVIAAVASGSVEKAETEFRTAAKLLDQSAASRCDSSTSHAAARTKSRLSARIKKMKEQVVLSLLTHPFRG